MDYFYKLLLFYCILFSITSFSSLANDNYYVHANSLNVRKTPDGKIVGKLGLNETVEVIGSTDEWYEIKYKGDNAFISKSYIKKRRFYKRDGLIKWFELNPNSKKTPVTLNHKDGFILLCEKKVFNGEFLNVNINDIYSDNYICSIAGCPDTIWLKAEQVIVDWAMVAKAFPGLYRDTETPSIQTPDNQTSKNIDNNNNDSNINWTIIITIFIIVLIVYRYWKKRNFIDSNDNRGTQWVYALSNPAFGDDVYKIGMTTRPNLRVDLQQKVGQFFKDYAA